jgi:RNA polymerase sigma-70 factor, ECF subfamily
MADVTVDTALQEENALIARLKADDPGAIDEVVEKYKRQLFAFILRMIDNHESAEDIFQETWMRVVHSVKNFRGDARFSTWLFQIAGNLCRDSLRKSKKGILVPLEEAEYVTCDPGVDPVRMLEAEQVKQVVNELPIKMREVIVLRYYHDMTDAEISQVVGCPLGTVKTRFHRAIKILSGKWKMRVQSPYEKEGSI